MTDMRRPRRGGATRLARAVPVALLAAFAAPGGAPLWTQPAQAQTFRFDQVRIEGNRRIEAGTILATAGIPRGEPVAAAEVNAALQNLLASGLFSDVQLVPQGGTLVIRVTEQPIVGEISIEGNRRLDDEALTPLLSSQPRRVFDPALAEADAEAIGAAYRQEGRLSVSVRPRIIRRGDDRVDLVFEVDETRVVEVERLSFVGNRAYSDRRLRRVLETKQAGLFRRLVGRDRFDEGRLRADRQALTDFYLDRGYADFEIRSVNSEVSRERDAFFITFDVREGQRFRLGNVRVTSEVPGIDPAAYAQEVRARPGAIYSPRLVEGNVDRLENLATRQGAAFVRVDPRVTRNPRAGTLDVEFAVVRGPRVFVERIDIEGNATTLDGVIRRQFDIVEGDPFDPRAVRAAADRIRGTGFFAAVDVEAREGSSPDQVLIDVDVEEQETGSLSFGGAYSAESGFGLTLGFRERNFLGRGQSVGFSLSTTGDNNDSAITFYEPALLGRDLGFRTRAFYRTSNSFNADFDTEEGGVSFGIDFPAGEYRRIALSYSLGFTDLTVEDADGEVEPGELPPSPTLLAEAERGSEIESAVGYTLSYDTRGTGLNPDAGVFLSFGQDVAGVGGDAQFVRSRATAAAETRLPRSDLFLRAEVEGGVINPFGGYETRVTDRFFTSTSTLRGFESRGVGPRQANDRSGDPLGGDAFVTARLDASFPLPLPEEYGLSGGAFVDAGSVWSLDGAAEGVDEDFELRAAAGVSLIFRSPIGPLRFDFSTPLRQEDYDREQNFNFSIATNF